MRVLCVTRLFPNRAEPAFGPFNRKQLAALQDIGWEVAVVNPIPWFPGAGLFKGKTRASLGEAVPRRDTIANLEVTHPRFVHIPRVTLVHPPLYAAGIAREAFARRKSDVILSPFAYPDGVASVLIGEALRIPVAIKLHGGDMNVAAKNPPAKRWLSWAFQKVSRVVAVSYPLAEAAASFGVPWSKIAVVEDGVDSTLFKIRDRAEAKRSVGLDASRRHIVYIGRLEKRKGTLELNEAFAELASRVPDVDLVLVGDGESTAECQAFAEKMKGRVILTGTVGPDDVATYHSAADIATLPSHAEGTPNSIIEALACGVPVVATSVGGIPDMIHHRGMGELVPPKDVPALIAAFETALAKSYDPRAIVAATGRGTWHDSARALSHVLEGAVAER